MPLADPEVALLLAHMGHWIWEIVAMAPFLLIGGALLVAELLSRRNPERHRITLEDEEQAAERELDEILGS